MPKRDRLSTPPVHLTLDQKVWVACASLGKPFEIPTDPEEPAEVTEYRRDRERRAAKGDISALAALILMDPRYLTTAWLVETVCVLRSEAHFARTPQDRAHATEGLRLLGRALGAGDLRGRRPYPSPVHIAKLYDLLLPVYQQAKQRLGRPSPPPLALPYEYFDYFREDGPIPTGITPFRTPPPRTGKVVLSDPPYFTIPPSDLARIKEERPSELALERIAAIFGLGRGDPSDAIDWTRKLVQRGRRERKEEERGE